MSKFEMKDMSGALFRNDKGDNPQRPDYRGEALVENEVFRMSAWVQTPKSGGEKFLKIKFERPQEKPTGGAPAEQPKAQSTDTLPF
jgi:uncharacterized protein (DUF736 family)